MIIMTLLETAHSIGLIISVAVIALTLFLVLIKIWMQGPTFKSNVSLENKVVVITGANSGIGKECALEMARRGGKIIMLCRNIQKGEAAVKDIRKETSKGELLVYYCDLTSLASVRACAQNLNSTLVKIDILLNNAGVCLVPHSITEDGFEMTMGANHFGHFLLTNLLLPLLRKAKTSSTKNPTNARIVNVSSLVHDRGELDLDDINFNEKKENNSFQPIEAYYRSKLANVLFTKELARRLQEEESCSVNTYALHPGVINTGIGRHLKANYPVIGFLACIFFPLSKTPYSGAQTSLYCCLEQSLGKETGEYYSDCRLKSPGPQALNTIHATKLWEISENLTGLNKPEQLLTHTSSNKPDLIQK